MKESNKAKSLETLLVLVGALIVVFWVSPKKIYLLIALIFILIGVVSPVLSAKISWVWMKFAELIGAVMSKIILSVVYFVFLVPIALIYRLTQKNPLFLKRRNDTYYIDRNKQYSPKDIENIW
jgi:ABC-type multidrug transport system fused ATPase/permease subunit